MSNSDALSGSIQKTSSELYDRTLYVNGIKLLIGGEQPDVNHSEVPDEWAYKVAQSIKLVMDPLAAGIAVLDQERMKEVLAGDEGTWHEREGGTVQRILKGGGDEYPLNPLKDSNEGDLDGEYGSGTEDLLVGAANDMVWYQNSSHGDVNATGDDDVTELFEHIMHTIHLFGVRGAVDGSLEALNYTTEFGDEHEQDDSGWKNSELYLAVEEANYNGVFTPEYMPETFADWNGHDFAMAAKEYTYLLNFSMWEMGEEFWTDKNADGEGTLAPEWSDSASTPAGVLSVNPLGYALFNTYFAPVLSKPNFETLRSMFQDNDGGVSGYVAKQVNDDTFEGNDGDNTLSGGDGTDKLSGSLGNDTITASPGNDLIDGGEGIDTAIYSGYQTSYTLTLGPSSTIMTDRTGTEGTDTLINIEKLTFADRTLDLDNYSSLTQLNDTQFSDLAEMYVAYFNRAPDAEGLFYWADKLAEGRTMDQIAERFFDQDETRALYTDPSNTDAFVTAVYANVLGRTPDEDGFKFWTGKLAAGEVTQGAFVLKIILGAKNGGGANDVAYLSDKADVGLYFSAIKGMSDSTDGRQVMAAFGDQSTANKSGAKTAVDGHYADATASGDGEFIFNVVGVVSDPFADFA
jgi:hypothetical protein